MKLAGRLPAELHADLTAYAQYYREVLSEPIAVWPLVVQMLRAFVDSDREFHAWRRRRPVSAAADATSSRPSRSRRDQLSRALLPMHADP